MLSFVNAVRSKDSPHVEELSRVVGELRKVFHLRIMEPFTGKGRPPNCIGEDAKKILGQIDAKSGKRDGYKAPSDDFFLRGYIL